MIDRLLNRLKKINHETAAAEYPDLPPIGALAPDFTLPATNGIRPEGKPVSITLSSLRGNPTILVFYPADNSSVCTSQLALYNEALDIIKEHNASLIAISTDNLESHLAFTQQLNLHFPLLSDSNPAGVVSNEYGVLNPEDGLCERAIFVLDCEGVIHWRAVFPRKYNPGLDGILEALEDLGKE
ncbi:MAG: redoxin domain-containing protein [Candidatus Promineifilaceae bacterium]|jgi:peroxiredoxin